MPAVQGVYHVLRCFVQPGIIECALYDILPLAIHAGETGLSAVWIFKVLNDLVEDETLILAFNFILAQQKLSLSRDVRLGPVKNFDRPKVFFGDGHWMMCGQGNELVGDRNDGINAMFFCLFNVLEQLVFAYFITTYFGFDQCMPFFTPSIEND